MRSAALVLDRTPETLRPIVQVIDNCDHDRNPKLGMIFEAKIGPRPIARLHQQFGRPFPIPRGAPIEIELAC